MTVTVTDEEIKSITDNAINSALQNKWDEAVEFNELLLKKSKKNIDALNRLGFAYLQLGREKDAKKCYEKTLTFDKYNTIAIKNLQKIELFSKSHKNENPCSGNLINPMLFLEDPGKTKIIQCVKLAPYGILSKISCGQEVFFKPKNHALEIRNTNNEYLGALPDDISFRLLKLLSANNKYSIHIKNVDKNQLSVFVREIQRGKKFSNQPTFGVSLQHNLTIQKSEPSVTADPNETEDTRESEPTGSDENEN